MTRRHDAAELLGHLRYMGVEPELVATETCPYALRLRFPEHASEGAIEAISHVVGLHCHELGRLLAQETTGEEAPDTEAGSPQTGGHRPSTGGGR